jgi:hypothetical protein
MNDEPRRTLRELIARHGPGLCSDARRCEGLLRDLCGGHRREVNTLVGALRERVPLDLLASRNSVPTGLLLSRLAKRLEDQLALTADASRWAVDSWALALGVVSEVELGELKSRRDAAAPPRVEGAPPARQTPTAPRPAAEDETRAGGRGAGSGTRPPASPPPPPARQTTPPPARQTPPPARQTPPPAPRATRTGAQGGGATVAPWQPSPPPAARPPATPQPANAGASQTTATKDPAARVGRGRRRGCWVGCLLLLLLLVLLAAGAPFVIDLLREEQLQREAGPAPGQTR